MFHGLVILLAVARVLMPAQSSASDGVSVPITFFQGRPVIQVTINSSGPYAFILDTGAAGSVLDLGLSEELGLPVKGASRLGSPVGGEPIEAKIVEIGRMEIGGIVIPDSRAMAADLAHVFGTEGALRGVLSTAIFEDFLLTVDYPGERIVVAEGSLPEPDGKTVLAYELLHGLPAIPVVIAGKTFLLHMDTGSPSGVTLPDSHIEDLPLASEPLEVGRARLVDGERIVKGTSLEGKVRVGSLELENPRINFLEGSDVGNVGYEILGQFAITLDQKSRRVALAAPAEGAGSDARADRRRPRRYGVAFQGLEGDFLTVARVDAGSPAEEAGLRAGDRILRLNGQGVDTLDTTQRAQAMRSPQLALLVERDGAKLEIEMSLDPPED